MTAPEIEDANATTAGTEAEPVSDAESGATAASADGRPTLTRRRAIGVVGAGLGIGLGGFAVTRLGGPNDGFLPDAVEYAGAGPIAWEVGLREPGPPTIAGETVLVGGSDESGDRSLIALSAASGHLEWRSPVAVAGAPVVEDGTVFAGSWDGEVYALDADDGETLWSQYVGRVTSSPAVHGDGLFVAADGAVHALDAATGSRRWETDTAAVGSHATPAPSADLVVIGSDEGSVVALSPSDGSVQWEFPTGASRCTGPTVVDDGAYVGTNSRGGDSAALFAISLADGAERWRFETPDDVGSAPMVTAGTVYVGSHDPVYFRGHVHAVDATEGSEQWTVETAGDVSTEPAIREGEVYITNPTASPGGGGDRRPDAGGRDVDDRTYDGALSALDPSSGRTRWTFETGQQVTAPVAADGRVVFGSGEAEQLYAVDIAAAVAE